MACEWVTKFDMQINGATKPSIPVVLNTFHLSYNEAIAHLEDLRRWLDDPEGGSTGTYHYTRGFEEMTFMFSDPDTAFAFKMRWA